MYRIKITARAKKNLKLLSKSNFLAIGWVLEDLKEDPYLGKPLGRELLKRYTYRVGVYRIVYKINKKDKCVVIISTGHRSTVYN